MRELQMNELEQVSGGCYAYCKPAPKPKYAPKKAVCAPKKYYRKPKKSYGCGYKYC